MTDNDSNDGARPHGSEPEHANADAANAPTSGGWNVPPPALLLWKRRWWLPVALVLVVVLVAAGAVVFVQQRNEKHYPSEWDARVQPYISFVERERGLDFKHPVEVEFMPEAEFRKTVETDDADLSDDDKQEIEDTTAMLRALGLAEGKLDLVAAENELAGGRILAYYDPDAERVRVRGTKLDVPTRVTLVHELTHVLQDQHFDIDKVREEAGEDGSSAATGLIEGDADSVESAYVESLSAAQQRTYERQNDSAVDDLEDSEEGIPPVLGILLQEPYAFGPALVAALKADGGQDALDDAFRNPPRTEADLVDPRRFVDRDTIDPPAAPKLPEGAKKVDDGEFGMFGLFLTLAEHIDPHRALAAMDAWQGDHFVSYRQNGRLCVQTDFRDADGKILDALGDWAQEMPAGMAAVSAGKADKNVTHVRSCDPGAKAKATTGRVEQAVTLPLVRSGIFGEVADSDLSLDVAWCVADRIVGGYSPEQLAADEVPADLTQRAQDAGFSCAQQEANGDL